MSVRATVLEVIGEVAAQQNKKLAPLTDDLPLLESGLDSLCIAVTVALLDDRLGLDPFAEASAETLPVTLGDFIKLYKNARP
ncbi:MAG: hypothetical protein ACREEA_03305 [Stellaceae bacterium]